MVLGLYYLSMERQEKTPEYVETDKGEKVEKLPMFSDMAEVHQALETKQVSLHTKILARVPQADESGAISMQRFETTAGRMLIGECLPKNHKVPFDIVNRLLTKKDIPTSSTRSIATPARTRSSSPMRSRRWASATRSRQASRSVRTT